MSDEPDKPKKSSWITFWIVMGAMFGFCVLARVFKSPSVDTRESFQYPVNPVGPYAPLDGGASTRIKFGAGKAVEIAIGEVKKREGLSANPALASVELGEAALAWEVIVRRASLERRVAVSPKTGKVLAYEQLRQEPPDETAP
jgi:hypothetical protein